MADVHELRNGSILRLDDSVSSDRVASWCSGRRSPAGGGYIPNAEFEVLDSTPGSGGTIGIRPRSSGGSTRYDVPTADLRIFTVVG